MKKVTGNKLTDKQKAFCIYYVKNGWNGTQAAIKAGYSEKTAAIIANQNLIKLNIQDEINRLKGNLEEVCNISKGMIIQEHRKIAFSSITHLHDTWITLTEFQSLTDDQKECIQEISTKVVKIAGEDSVLNVEYVKIKLYDKQKSLESISKIMGYDAPTKLQVETEITGFNINIRRS